MPVPSNLRARSDPGRSKVTGDRLEGGVPPRQAGVLLQIARGTHVDGLGRGACSEGEHSRL